MNRLMVPALLVALAVGAGGGYWLASKQVAPTQGASAAIQKQEPAFYRHPMNPEITSPVPAKDEMGMDYVPVYAQEEAKQPAQRRILFYRNPMNPEVTSPVPAKDSMGMDYVPVYADEGNNDSEPGGTVKIDPVTVQNIGVKTATAVQRTLAHTIQAVARVEYDEESIRRLHPKTEGWIEHLQVDKTGEWVEKDAILLSIYSPTLVTSQQEYLLALKNLASLKRLKGSPYADIFEGARDLVESSRKRLEMLDVPAHQLRELERDRVVKKSLHIHSPFDGIVLEVGAREGQYVTPKTELYRIADIRKVWVHAGLYENELPWVQVGDEAEMRLTGVPGQVFKGRVTYIYPYADSKTRTVKVRLEFENPKLLLKPDMFADVRINASRQLDAVVVPAEAIVRSGPREQVFVVRAPGKFEPREVRLGVTTDGLVQVLEGLTPGEEIVTSALFLIDSESKLREATSKMLEAPSD